MELPQVLTQLPLEHLNTLMDATVEAVPHLLVAGKRSAKCQGSKEECSQAFNMMLDENPEYAMEFATKYWFAGLPYMVLGVLVLPFTMPYQAWFFSMDEESMPGPIPASNKRFGEGLEAWWNWLSLYTARLFMPYFYFAQEWFEGDASVNDWNLRGMMGDEGAAYFMSAWLAYPLIWVQAVVMFVVTLPVYPWMFFEWVFKKLFYTEGEMGYEKEDDDSM